ncbi:MAG: DNA repair protein RecN [Pontibacterium sp.]
MLTQIAIQNFAIVDVLELDVEAGMTVISGETGAGKSITLDALGLALGNRADSLAVRNGTARAEIIASFDISDIPEAAKWLTDNELENDSECILRRVVTSEGRSRCYINGRTSPISMVRDLAQYLVDIHGQHEHQRLLKRDYHRTLLDQFAKGEPLAKQVRLAYKQWQAIKHDYEQRLALSESQSAHLQLLRYQLDELEQLALEEGEAEALENELQQLEHAADIIQSGHSVIELCQDAESGNCVSMLYQCIQRLEGLPENPRITQVVEMLSNAQIQIEEASAEIRHHVDTVDVDPQRLDDVTERLSAIYNLARKHKVEPKLLPQRLASLHQELANNDTSDEALNTLKAEVESAKTTYFEAAKKLSDKRAKAAKALSKQVDSQLTALGMSAAHFSVDLSSLEPEKASVHGLEAPEFLISTNKGLPAGSLSKIASGGELSRISLAIQVITAQTSHTPTIVFDEVDVGIGGAIAEVVGRLMRTLGTTTQVLCVTHQPQVASQGNQHLFVSKKTRKGLTATQVNLLTKEQRTQEIARMLGGVEITERSIEHAREMLSLACESSGE